MIDNKPIPKGRAAKKKHPAGKPKKRYMLPRVEKKY